MTSFCVLASFSTLKVSFLAISLIESLCFINNWCWLYVLLAICFKVSILLCNPIITNSCLCSLESPLDHSIMFSGVHKSLILCLCSGVIVICEYVESEINIAINVNRFLIYCIFNVQFLVS